MEHPVRSTILWLENARNPGTVIGHHEGTAVFPSQPLQNGIAGVCQTRRELPKVGQYERCVIFKPDGRTTWLAYPDAVDYSCIQMPGIDRPYKVTWEANEQHPDEVISGFIHGQSYFRIYVHENWPGQKPKAGESTLCNIKWMKHYPKGQVLGHAMPICANEVANIGDTGVKVTIPNGRYTVGAKLAPDGTIAIILTPMA